MKKYFGHFLQLLLLSILFAGCEPKGNIEKGKKVDKIDNIQTGSEKMNENQKVLYTFEKPNELKDWMIVNDGVMGGLSKGTFRSSDNKTALFQGTVSLENYGGFTSTRTKPKSFELSDFEGIMIRLKGDGKKYQFRLHTNDKFDGVSYRYVFGTKDQEWITVKVPFNKCDPTFRGRILDNVEPISPKMVQQVGFLISEKQSGPFKLEVDWIKAYKK